MEADAAKAIAAGVADLRKQLAHRSPARKKK
jgi:hypothetical protein